MIELIEAYYLKIHWDNHHCSSCWEPSDEWDTHLVLQDIGEVKAAIAQALADPQAKRYEFEVLKCPAVKDDLDIFLLHDPTNTDHPIKGDKVEIDLHAIQLSEDYEKARIAKARRQEEARKSAEESAARAAKVEAERKEAEERKRLAELKAKYEGGA